MMPCPRPYLPILEALPSWALRHELAGFMVASGDPFTLDVRPNGHVEGQFGSAPVEYDVSKKVRDGVAEQLGEARAFAQASN